MRRRNLLLAIVVLLILWQLASLIVNEPILPGPITVGQAFFEEITGDLAGHFLYSTARVLASVILAVALAAPAGLILGQSERLNQIFSPFVYMLYPIPKVVLIPVILLLFGVGDLPKIIIIFLILFFQILVLVRDRAASIEPKMILSVRSLGAGRRALFRYVYLPASLSAIGHSHRLAPIGWNSRGRFICRRAIRHPKRTWLLHFSEWEYLAQLSGNVRGRCGHEPAGPWSVL